MIGKNYYQCCYSCDACVPTKQTCKRKNMYINNIYEVTSCPQYSEYPLWTCCICGEQFRNINAHLKTHGMTMNQYKIYLQKGENKSRRLSVWQK